MNEILKKTATLLCLMAGIGLVQAQKWSLPPRKFPSREEKSQPAANQVDPRTAIPNASIVNGSSPSQTPLNFNNTDPRQSTGPVFQGNQGPTSGEWEQAVNELLAQPQTQLPDSGPTEPVQGAQQSIQAEDLSLETLQRAIDALQERQNNTSTPQVEPTTEAPEEMIAIDELKFNNMPLEQFLDFYAEFVGKTLLKPTSLASTQVSLKAQTPLSRKEAIQAMDSVLALNGITIIPTGEKFVTAVTAQDALSQGAAFSDTDSAALPEASQFVTQIVQLKKLSPEEIIAAITPFSKNPAGLVALESSRVVILRDYAINVKRMLEVIEKIDIDPPQEFELKPEVIPIKYAMSSDIATVIGSLSPSGVSTSIGQSGRTMGAGTSGGLRSRGNTGAGGLNSSLNSRNTANTSNRNTGAATSNFSQRLNQIVSRAAGGPGMEMQILGEMIIIPDERTNSILLFATEKDLKMIREIIEKLDVVLAQVLIESIVLEASINDDLDFGVSSAHGPWTGGDFQGAGGSVNPVQGGSGFLGSFLTNSFSGNSLPGGFTYGVRSSKLDVAVRALASKSEVKLVSRPRIQTSHGITGSFFVGDTVPTITSSGFSDFSNFARSTFQQLEVGIRLDVTPWINPEGLVVMEIEQTIDALGPSVDIDGNAVPTTTSRIASGTVAVRDQETILLGGFIKSDNSRSDSGVPYLKDIPVLGNLFKSQRKKQQRTEMLVLMKPTVLPTPEMASISATQQRNMMQGIGEIEEDFKDEQAERKKSSIQKYGEFD